jgi:hypothetical protein
MAVAVHDTTVLLDGNFSDAGGVASSGLVGVDLTQGLATRTQTEAIQAVFALAIRKTTIFAGVDKAVDNFPTPFLESFSLSSGSLVLAVETRNPVRALTATRETPLYAGGQGAFTINGQPASLAELDPNTGAVVSGFNPLPTGSDLMNSLALAGNRLYVGGLFETIGQESIVLSLCGLRIFRLTARVEQSLNWGRQRQGMLRE